MKFLIVFLFLCVGIQSQAYSDRLTKYLKNECIMFEHFFKCQFENFEYEQRCGKNIGRQREKFTRLLKDRELVIADKILSDFRKLLSNTRSDLKNCLKGRHDSVIYRKCRKKVDDIFTNGVNLLMCSKVGQPIKIRLR